ncbi:MAG: DUF4139 domain-containing protein [Archangium sp.]
MINDTTNENATRTGGSSSPHGVKTIQDFAAMAKNRPVSANAMPPPPPPPAPVMKAMAMPSTTVAYAQSAPMAAPSAVAPPMPGAVGGMARQTRTGSYEPAPEMQASAPKGGGFGGLFRGRAAAKRDEDGAVYDQLSEVPADEEQAEGGYFGADLDDSRADADDRPSGMSAPGGDFGDYARLMMPAFENVGFAARGRLASASEWDFAFVAGLSVQVDVVMAIVTRAQRTANQVNSLQLPALCNPVTSIKSFDYRYDCGARLDVPSTGKWVLVPVMKCAVGLTPEYVCVPSVEQKVYRTLTIANRSTHALLPGPVDVTSGDEFLMTTSLPAIPPGAGSSGNAAAHRLGLGVEEAIKVARKTQYKETTGGFLGGSAVLPHDVEIELNNRLAVPALIEVRERVPVVTPGEKDLKVEEANVAPAWEKVETPIDDQVMQGARRWRVTVPAGQSMKLTAQYAIRMPNDRMLVGGNRRN